MSDPRIPQGVWDALRERLGYGDEEAAAFQSDPRNARVLAAARDMRKKTIVFEVIESAGCNSEHTVGTRFFFSGDGNLITAMAPPRLCAYLMPVMSQQVFGLQELWYAGVDPNQMCFRRAGCFDVGARCGGWGNVKIEVRVVDAEEAAALASAQRR